MSTHSVKSALAGRIAIQHAVGNLADALLLGEDLPPYLNAHERVARLSACLGDVATDVLENRQLDQDALLLRLAAEVQVALEVREREAAAT